MISAGRQHSVCVQPEGSAIRHCSQTSQSTANFTQVTPGNEPGEYVVLEVTTSSHPLANCDRKFLLPSSIQKQLLQEMPRILPPAQQPYFQHDPSQAPPRRQVPGQAIAPAKAQLASQRIVFRNLAEAKAAMATRPLDRPWHAPRNDDTIPRNNQERATYVVALLDAMKDSANCCDKRNAPAFRTRWMPDGSNRPNPGHMEVICWKLVDIAERLHRDGPSSLHVYDSEAMKTIWKSRGLTFAGHIQKLVELLRLSKARCLSLLKGESLYTTVGAPAQKYSSTTRNFDQNGKCDELITAGRPLVKHKKAENPPVQYTRTAEDIGNSPAPVPGPNQRPPTYMPRNTPAAAPASTPLSFSGHYFGGRNRHEHNTFHGQAVNYMHQVGNAEFNQPGGGDNAYANRAAVQL